MQINSVILIIKNVHSFLFTIRTAKSQQPDPRSAPHFKNTLQTNSWKIRATERKKALTAINKKSN